MKLRVLSSLLLPRSPGNSVGSASLFECREIQPAKSHLSLHLQLHGEGCSVRSEAGARLGSGAAD